MYVCDHLWLSRGFCVNWRLLIVEAFDLVVFELCVANLHSVKILVHFSKGRSAEILVHFQNEVQ